ncbi:MAG: very short patch repair endonuclease [Candidatus Altiarchaeota archaeon]
MTAKFTKLSPPSKATTNVMKANRPEDTQPELIMRQALRKVGLGGYRLHWDVPGKPDIAYPDKKIAIFVHGCFWHRCPYCKYPMPKTNRAYWAWKFRRNIKRDKRKKAELKRLGWRVLNFWECKVKKNTDRCVERVRASIIR